MKRTEYSPDSASVVIERLLTPFCRGGGAGRYSRRHPRQPLTPSTGISGFRQPMDVYMNTKRYVQEVEHNVNDGLPNG